MTERIFADAEATLRAYVETPPYIEHLKASLAALAKVLPAEGTVFEIARRDGALLDILRPLCPPGASIGLADDIVLGGMRGVNAAAGMLADDTLDTRLESQRAGFVSHSGLTVG